MVPQLRSDQRESQSETCLGHNIWGYVMEYRKPDEVSSWEYLCEHLYEPALKGRYEVVFEACQLYISALCIYKDFKDYLQTVEDSPTIKQSVMDCIKMVCQRHYEARPVMAILLLLTLWTDLPTSRLEDFYYDLLTEVLGGGDKDA